MERIPYKKINKAAKQLSPKTQFLGQCLYNVWQWVSCEGAITVALFASYNHLPSFFATSLSGELGSSLQQDLLLVLHCI